MIDDLPSEQHEASHQQEQPSLPDFAALLPSQSHWQRADAVPSHWQLFLPEIAEDAPDTAGAGSSNEKEGKPPEWPLRKLAFLDCIRLMHFSLPHAEWQSNLP